MGQKSGKMDVGLDRRQVKGKPGVHVHFYTSQNPKVYTIGPHELTEPISTEKLCVRIFSDERFQFDEKETTNEEDRLRIYPGTLHLFQLWDCETRQYKAPNEEIVLSAAHCSVELVLRIRFKYPPSLEKNNFNDVWDTGAFYYYFAQCRFDFIHDTLHDIYHCHIKEDLCIGLALVDMSRLAFEKGFTKEKLKDKYEYHAFLPRHVARKIKNILVRLTLHKSSTSALDDTYDSFYSIGTNPHKNSVVSYLKKLLPSVPEYASEEFTVLNHVSKSTRCVVHPYSQKSPGIFMDLGKGNTEPVGMIPNLTAIELKDDSVALLHFTNSKPQRLEFVDVHQARSFVSMLDGYYRLMYDYHYSLSNQVFSPIVKLWNELKCYGPLSKEYMKVIWRRNAASVVEGSFLIKQRSTSFTDYVIIVHKMGRNFPAIPIIYDANTNTYSCDELTMKQVFHSHHRPVSFNTVRELIRYYRSGDFKHLKLTTQLSPVPKEEIPLMICRDRAAPLKEINPSPTVDLNSVDAPLFLSPNDVQRGKDLGQSHHGMFTLMEGMYCKEKVVIREVNRNLQNRQILTMFFQSDIHKVLKWRHEMIVRLYGICLSPFYAMSQRMLEGRLDKLLMKRTDSFQLYHCVRATGQLAQALMYLQSNGFTHGSVRCKNVLVSSFDAKDINIKLSGDMMASYMSSLPLTDKLNLERLPWLALERWTNLANETTEADVYSFGMTIWEIFSRGAKPFSELHTIDEVKIFIESGKTISLPTCIENFRRNMHQYSDQTAHEQLDSLTNVLYGKIIRTNISPDPSARMKPQDILREIILLDSLFSPDTYDIMNPAGQSPSATRANCLINSDSGNNLSPHTRQSQTPNGGSSPHIPSSHSSNDIADRPLPNIPLPAPPSQAHIIEQRDLLGFEDNSAKLLGRGFYGEVFLCKLLQRGGRAPIKCAVKKLIYRERDDEAAQKSLKEFERELKMMVPLNHQNIVRMYGECFYTFPDGQEMRMIVMEYVVCGSLAQFVKSRSRLVGAEEKLKLYKKFSLDIAEGMLFLHSLGEGVIHRDLAARNVLVTEKPHRAKITDFGLARVLTEKDYYRCDKNSILPLLWCAPESMVANKFTKASDVWSYAVLLWEMYSSGQRPYIASVKTKKREDGNTEVDLKSLVQVLSSSGPNTRLPKQPDLSPDMYNLMMRCWQTDPAKRPSFDIITHELKAMW